LLRETVFDAYERRRRRMCLDFVNFLLAGKINGFLFKSMCSIQPRRLEKSGSRWLGEWSYWKEERSGGVLTFGNSTQVVEENI
jgi:hypothetical protein